MPKTTLEHYLDRHEELRERIKPTFVNLAAIIGEATMVRAYHDTIVSGVVQTPPYRDMLNVTHGGSLRPEFWLAGAVTQAIRSDLSDRGATVQAVTPTEVLAMSADIDPTVKREQLKTLESHTPGSNQRQTVQLLAAGSRDTVGSPFMVLSNEKGPFATYYERPTGEPSILDQDPAHAQGEAERFDALLRDGSMVLSLAASQELIQAELASL